MITTTQKPFRPRPSPFAAAFTLVEVMIAASLGAVIMTAVLSAFIFVSRSTINLRNYADQETQARNAVVTFAQDARMASDVNWVNADTLTLLRKEGGLPVSYTYTYSSLKRNFTRQQTAPTAGPVTVLTSNITSFAFSAYQIDTSPVDITSPSANRSTKQVQISLETRRNRSESGQKQATLSQSTNRSLSARFVLRNKLRTT